MYWSTFGALKGVRLEDDRITFASDIVDVNTLIGFFEAPWIMKRGSTYYMLYAANNAGPDSPCTPTTYHACIAYGTASAPLGSWTFQGVMLAIVSSTTSHPGAVQYGNQWYLVYHTADAEDGGNFRRSMAYDRMEFDDASSPPKILPVQQTFRTGPPPAPTYERGQYAVATSEPPNSVVYWIKALKDLKVPRNPLPPQYWSSYDRTRSAAQSTLTYEWNSTVKLSSTSVAFFTDQAAGAVIGVAPPTAWRLEYRASDGTWRLYRTPLRILWRSTIRLRRDLQRNFHAGCPNSTGRVLGWCIYSRYWCRRVVGQVSRVVDVFVNGHGSMLVRNRQKT